jgi:hypothetical protein
MIEIERKDDSWQKPASGIVTSVAEMAALWSATELVAGHCPAFLFDVPNFRAYVSLTNAWPEPS